MSLYTYAIWPDRAIIAADTRQCVIVDGKPYRKNDVTFKLHAVDDMAVTIGGQGWLCRYIMQCWSAGNDHTIQRLHEIVLEAVEHITEIAKIIDPSGEIGEKTKGDNFSLEILVLQYDKGAGHNVLWQISSYNGFELERHDVTMPGQTMVYGGIRTEIVQEHIKAHPTTTIEQYLKTLHTAYTQAANEEVGGFLSLAVQDATGVRLNTTWAKIPDSGKVRNYIDNNVSLSKGIYHVGRQLIIDNPQVDANNNPTGVMQFKVDSTGAWLNNSTFVLQKDGGGKILLDPKYGIVAGTTDLFDTDGTTVLPSFINEDGELVLDKLGMPEKANFFLDLRDGSAYFRGNVYAEDGVFNGTVYATKGEFDGIIKARDIRLPSGDTMTSIINKNGKIDAKWLELMGISIQNDRGDTVMTIDQGGVRFGTGYSPVQYQFATSESGPWHSAMGANDKYRRESFDGGTTWGTPFQFRGTDGRPGYNGSDANVTYDNMLKALQKAESTKTAFITADEIGAPTLYGAKIYGAEIYAGGIGEKGGQVIGLTDGGINIFDGKSVGEVVLTIAKNSNDRSVYMKTGYNTLSISAANLNISDSLTFNISTDCVDFSGAGTIKWGKNAPTAVFA